MKVTSKKFLCCFLNESFEMIRDSISIKNDYTDLIPKLIELGACFPDGDISIVSGINENGYMVIIVSGPKDEDNIYAALVDIASGDAPDMISQVMHSC